MIRYIFIITSICFWCIITPTKAQSTDAVSKKLQLVQAQLDALDDLLLKIKPISRAIETEKRKDQVSEWINKIIVYADQTQEKAKRAEQLADEVDAAARAMNCFTAATEADDGEDYCRHMTYYTKEISIYARKARNESDANYARSYIAKVLTYTEETYESLKNARLEFEDCLKDLESCN